jgi:hypothetical protein
MRKGNNIVRRKIYTGPDFYETPKWATEALLEHVKFSNHIWEPACGFGAISKVLEKENHTVWSSDIMTDIRCYGKLGMDFLETKRHSPNIVTNPPYKLAEAFVMHGLECVTQKLALLLRLTFLESRRRYQMFQDTPLEWVLPFSERLTMHPHGTEPPKSGGTAAYAWFVWNWAYDANLPPKIDWIKPRQ